MKGPDGFLVYIFEVISLIEYFFSLIFDMALFISSLFLKLNFSIFSPFNSDIKEVKIFFEEVIKFTFIVQNSSGLNTSISCSLSVNNLKATD